MTAAPSMQLKGVLDDWWRKICWRSRSGSPSIVIIEGKLGPHLMPLILP